ncbi:MAG: WcaI family glycosyltransferase [Verrucomicrobiota bacterium]|nr:WcaI family glycosyltransferase [Verrucomicrobiota bacterium]
MDQNPPKEPLKIIVWGINYSPELTGIAPYNAALCDYLKEKGSDVRMVTSFPYYPSWKKIPGEEWLLHRKDDFDGVPVHRCWHYVPEKPNSLKRILHEGSFVLTSFIRLLFLPRPDVYIVVSPPLLLGAAAWMLTLIKGGQYIFHVQDLQPDAALGLGMLKKGLFTRMLYKLEAIAYRHAVRVSGISEGMLNAFRSKNVPESKILYFPNGVVLPDRATEPPRGLFRLREGLSEKLFLVVYSGNLGVKQGLDILVQAASQLRAPNVMIIICGEGATKPQLAEAIKQKNLTNIKLLPLQSDQHYKEMLVDADLSVITQQKGTGSFFFPSKLLINLAYFRPVLTVADSVSELAKAVTAGNFGVNVEPENAAALTQAIEQLATNPERLKNFGLAGRTFVEQFEFSKVLFDFYSVLRSLAKK